MKNTSESSIAPRQHPILPPEAPPYHSKPRLPTNEAEFIAKWETEAAHFQRFRAWVDGAAVCRALLSDLAHVRDAGNHQVLSLEEASEWSGYSKTHLMRLVKSGQVSTLRPPSNRGRLSFLRADLPRKPGRQHRLDAGVHELASRLAVRGKGGRHGRS